MAEARHFCPDCGNIEIITEEKSIIRTAGEAPAGEGKAKCPNCGWAGTMAETLGAVTSEKFWDLKRISDVLVRVISRHAAGPFVQVMEFVGLMPRMLKQPTSSGNPELKAVEEAATLEVTKNNEIVEQARDSVLKSMIGAAITAGFEEAERWHRIWAVKMNKPLHGALKDDHQKERQFGGDVSKKDN